MRLLRYYQKSMVWNFSDFMHEVFGPKRGLKWVPNEVFKLIVKNQCMKLFWFSYMSFSKKDPQMSTEFGFLSFMGNGSMKFFYIFEWTYISINCFQQLFSFLFIYLFFAWEKSCGFWAVTILISCELKFCFFSF